MKTLDNRVFVCLGRGREFEYQQGEIGRCPYCGGELAVDRIENLYCTDPRHVITISGSRLICDICQKPPRR